MGRRNRTFLPALLLLALSTLFPVGYLAAQEASAALSARLLVGPWPDVPAFQYPMGVEGALRLAWYDIGETGAAEAFEHGSGWAVWATAGLLFARPIEPVFEPTLLGTVALQTGPSLLVGRALGTSLEIDLGGGMGYYLASYTFVGERVRSYRPIALAHLVVSMHRPRFGLRLEGGYTVFIEDQLRNFASVAVGVAVP